MPPPLRALDEQILSLLEDGQPRSTTDLGASIGVERHALRPALDHLRATGRIVALGMTPTRRQWGARQPALLWRLVPPS